MNINILLKNKKFTTIIVIISFIILISLTWIINQPEYTSANDFNRYNLEQYDDEDIIYIKDLVVNVEFQQSYYGSMLDFNIYQVRTSQGYTFDIETNNEKPHIKTGNLVILEIEIDKQYYSNADIYVERYYVAGYTETEFVLNYNSNWLIVFIEGALMFLLTLIIWQKEKIQKLDGSKKVLWGCSIGLMIISTFPFYYLSYNNVSGAGICFGIGFILFIMAIYLLSKSLKK